VFELSEETDVDWAHSVLEHLDEILLEHAHLERKAAQSAMQFMVRYPEREFFQQALSELAREELGHYEGVLAILRRRGTRFGPQGASPYAARLLAVVRADEPNKLIDRLLCAAVIEARSCERLKLLAQVFQSTGSDLAGFYQELSIAEARHYSIYVDFAREIAAENGEDVDRRLTVICEHEAEIVRRAPESPRLHNRPLRWRASEV
jgi:tRNA-(ms[2]io[6]A)-hydroxylase